MAASSACTFVYYATVYSAIQDVVPTHLRATAVSVYFFAFYVLGASFGPTIMGTLSDRMAQRAMLAAGASEMTTAFRATGLHTAMYVMPVLVLLCAASLFVAAKTSQRICDECRSGCGSGFSLTAPAHRVPVRLSIIRPVPPFETCATMAVRR
jgi:MFS family permease